jgi:hypothetical protein
LKGNYKSNKGYGGHGEMKKKVKLNCWQYKKCGREPGGVRESELGVCPAAIEGRADGINNGKKGGRVCWAIAGTLCEGEVQGTYASKIGFCLQCDFCQLVLREEEKSIYLGKDILERLK